MRWAAHIVSLGALTGIVTSLLVSILGMSRILVILGREKLVPAWMVRFLKSVFHFFVRRPSTRNETRQGMHCLSNGCFLEFWLFSLILTFYPKLYRWGLSLFWQWYRSQLFKECIHRKSTSSPSRNHFWYNLLDFSSEDNRSFGWD